VLEDLANRIDKSGGTVVTNVPLLGVNGIASNIDAIVLPSGATSSFGLEIKTGISPTLTPNQSKVYPLFQIGGHAMS
jgi:hypothetical protein